MSYIVQSSLTTDLIVNKLKNSLDNLSARLAEIDDSRLNSVLGETLKTFRKFFDELPETQFYPTLVNKDDLINPDLYNKNLLSIYQDVQSFYNELQNLENSQISSYNFSQIITSEIINRADSLASTVLDLNILNNFTRGDVIVAGDNFKNMEYIDSSVGLSSEQAELMLDGGGVGLARDSSRSVLDAATEISITPLSPLGKGSSVESKPTPGNLERFYEGNYYNFLGAARPEGGKFNIQYVLDPVQDPNKDLGGGVEGIPITKDGPGAINNTEGTAEEENNLLNEGFFVEYGASDEVKKLARRKMLDNKADTFWECEYVYKVPAPLLGNLYRDQLVIDDTTETPNQDENTNVSLSEPDIPQGSIVDIDLEQAEKAAQTYDYEGRDLIVEVIITFPETRNVNFVVINPILFGTQAFVRVRDIATASEEEGAFETVDGWNALNFAKSITPEANEYLTDAQLGASLAPSRYEYRGQGIYPFPVRSAKKLRLVISMDTPVGQPYERTLALLKKTITIEGTITTKTKRGLFG